jgi:hypothetical protein
MTVRGVIMRHLFIVIDHLVDTLTNLWRPFSLLQEGLIVFSCTEPCCHIARCRDHHLAVLRLTVVNSWGLAQDLLFCHQIGLALDCIICLKFGWYLNP